MCAPQAIHDKNIEVHIKEILFCNDWIKTTKIFNISA